MQTTGVSIRMGLFLLLPIFMVSCMMLKESNETTTQPDKSEIVFVVFKISHDSVRNKNTIEIVSKTKSEGQIKNNRQPNLTYDNYLTIEVYDSGKLSDTIVLEHPLFKRVEYSDGRTLQTKSIELDEAEFFIRFQAHSESIKLKIYETLQNISQNKLTTMKL